MWTTYGKAIAAVIAAALTAFASVMTDGITQAEMLQIAIAVCTAAGVYLVPAFPAYPATKTAIAVLLAVLNLAVSLITDGLTSAEIVNLALAGLGALGVAYSPSRSLTGYPPPGSTLHRRE